MPPSPCAVVRVSSDDQDFRQQKAEVIRWCAASLGVELDDADIYLEDGVSGWRNKTLDKRPGLQAAVAACLAGRYTHLIVHKVDRSARNVALMAGVIDQLQEHGVSFVSVIEGLDTAQLGAAFVIKLLLTFAEHFGNNLSAEVKKGKRGRIARGLYNGPLAFGAMPGADSVPIPDLRPLDIDGAMTTRYALLQGIWRDAGDGVNPGAIARRLNQTHLRTPRGKLWGRATVRQILDNRFYLGDIRDGAGGWLPGAHMPLITAAQWDRAHQRLFLHTQRPQRAKYGSAPRVFPQGMLRCAACGRGLHVSNSGQRRYYICDGRDRLKVCTAPLAREDVIERDALALLQWDISEAESAAAFAAFVAATRAEQSEADSITRKLAALQTRLRRLAELYELGDYTQATYHERRNATRRELAELERQRQHAAPLDMDDLRATLAMLQRLPQTWGELDTEGRAAVMTEIFHAIWLADGRITRVEPHADYAAAVRLVSGAYVEAQGS